MMALFWAVRIVMSKRAIWKTNNPLLNQEETEQRSNKVRVEHQAVFFEEEHMIRASGYFVL